MNEDTLSLHHQLMNWLLTPLALLWLFSMVTAYVTTLNFANQPYDVALLERAQLLMAEINSASLSTRGPAAPGATAPDGVPVYYALFRPDGRVLATNAPSLRPFLLTAESAVPIFNNAMLNGERIRVVSLRYAPDPARPKDALVLEVGESMANRQSLARGILANIVIPQLLLILLAVGAVWFGLRRGLAPLQRLREEVSQRSRDDLSPLAGDKAPEEVRPFIQAVNDLLARLKQVLEFQRRFIADAAHQLRTPFAGLITQAELALRERDPEKIRYALRQILTGAQRCSHLVNQLLSLARNEPGARPPGTPVTFDLARLARDEAAAWVQPALDKRIDFGFEPWAGPLLVSGNPEALAEMLTNLLDNAIRYTPPGGRVTLSVGVEEGKALLRVEDTGPGIAQEHRERVFERFYRVPDTGQEGSGLGLAIVREVVAFHGGTISLGDGPGGRGTAFTVRLPLRE